MILTRFDKEKIKQANQRLIDKNYIPVLYCSRLNASILAESINPFSYNFTPHEVKTEGFIGTYFGAIVYVTDEVENVFIIVPKLKEDN